MRGAGCAAVGPLLLELDGVVHQRWLAIVSAPFQAVDVAAPCDARRAKRQEGAAVSIQL